MPHASKQKIFSPKQLQRHNFRLGKKGENHARDFLLARGFLLLAENYQSRRGQEIDLVMLAPSQDILVFIEVKTRQSADYGSPALAVTTTKLRQIQAAAQDFRHHHWSLFGQLDFRFDVVSVLRDSGHGVHPEEIQHFPNVTWLKCRWATSSSNCITNIFSL